MIHSPFAFLGGTGDREKVEKMFAERERMYQHNLQRLGDIDRLKEKNEILSEEVKMKEELIPGMEKMIAHIKKLAEENKDLKEEKEELQEEAKGLQDEVGKWGQLAMGYREKWGEKIGENDKLKEENKKLKLMISRLPNDMEDKWWCENNQRWRWEGDGYEEEEETETEEESEEETTDK